MQETTSSYRNLAVRIIGVILILGVIILSDGPGRAAGQVLRLSGMERNAISETAARHLRRAYERIGIRLEIFPLPRKRALIAADRGDFDGVVARATIISRDYKNLIRVPAPVAYLRIRAYGRRGADTVATFEELRSLRIGILRGVPLLAQKTAGLDRHPANTPGQLMHMLKAGRVDAVLLAERVAESALEKEKLTNIVPISGVLLRSPLYHFLNRRHRGLVPAISKALAETTDSD